MRTSKVPVRLILHREEFHNSGRRGRLISALDLNEEEKIFMQDEFTVRIRERRLSCPDPIEEKDYDDEYVSLLSDWGIACPHFSHSVENQALGTFCHSCGCFLIGPGTRDTKVQRG
jgi:hypothetical protein